MAFQQQSRVFTLNWTQNLSKSTERALALETYLSYQQDQTLQGPMTTEGEASTRDPFGGFLIGADGLPVRLRQLPAERGAGRQLPQEHCRAAAGLRWTWRTGRSMPPATCTGTTPTASITAARPARDMQFYDNGIGSPLATRLIMYRENRWVGKANLDWQFDRYNRVKLGGEFTHYDIGNYSHQLDDQIFSDVFLEKPLRYNVFAEDRLDLGDVVLVGGLRYDWYHTPGQPAGGLPGHHHPPGLRSERSGRLLQQSRICSRRTRATATSARTSRSPSR